MDLTQALLQKPCAETVINDSKLLVERGNDNPFDNQCFTYDVYPAGHNRYHKIMFGDIGDVFYEIYENDDYGNFEDGQVERADWQPSDTKIDFSTCTCRDCYELCIEYHMLPYGISWQEAAWLTAKWRVQSLLWFVQSRWYLLHNRIQVQRALRRLDAEYSDTDEVGSWENPN
jgi:hypothetical protein